MRLCCSGPHMAVFPWAGLGVGHCPPPRLSVPPLPPLSHMAKHTLLSRTQEICPPYPRPAMMEESNAHRTTSMKTGKVPKLLSLKCCTLRSS